MDTNPITSTEVERLQSTNSKLAAEVERLKTACEKEFQSVEQLSGENMKLAEEIAELKEEKATTARCLADAVNRSATLRAELETVNQVLDNRMLQLRTVEAELETAKRTLFQTEKRLDGKLRAALAELEAARKELSRWKKSFDGHVYIEDSKYAQLCADRDTALAAKDAAEKRVAEANELMRELIAAQDDFDTASGALEQALFNEENGVKHNRTVRERVREARTRLLKARKAALTPAPTQEPPAGGKPLNKIDCFGGESALAKLTDVQSPAGGVKYHTPGCEASHGITAAGVEILTGKSCTCGVVTISNGTACSPTGETASQDTPSMAHGSGVATGSIQKQAAADVPSEGRVECVHGIKMTQVCEKCSRFLHFHHRGRGECPQCKGTHCISIDFGQVGPCPRCAFNLSDALAGKPVVTRDGQSVRYEDCVNNIILAWIGDARMMWWDNGKFTHRSEPDPLDLFMLPTEGSGA